MLSPFCRYQYRPHPACLIKTSEIRLPSIIQLFSFKFRSNNEESGLNEDTLGRRGVPILRAFERRDKEPNERLLKGLNRMWNPRRLSLKVTWILFPRVWEDGRLKEKRKKQLVNRAALRIIFQADSSSMAFLLSFCYVLCERLRSLFLHAYVYWYIYTDTYR